MAAGGPSASVRAVVTAGGLEDRLARREARIAVLGLGYVGIPVAVSLAAAGFDVVGIDTDDTRVATLAAGKLPLATREPGLDALLAAALASGRFGPTTSAAALAGRDVVIVAVDTPIDAHRRPDTAQLAAACRAILDGAGDAQAVVVESTLAPGTMRRVVRPILAERRPMPLLIHCPERVRPGRLLRNLRGMSRLIGVEVPAAGPVGVGLYGTIVDAELVVTDWETAELIKVAENTTRDIQIALANQLAVAADHAGVDFRRVRDQINALWRSEPLVLEPGAGVGGHCLPKDPWLLASVLPPDATTDLIRAARAVNDRMPTHVARIVDRMCAGLGIGTASARVVVLGLTYDANSDDQRNAPGPRIVAALASRGAEVVAHDPFVGPGALSDAVQGSDVAVVVIPHRAYLEADWAALGASMRHPAVIDCRRALEGDALRSLGFSYRALGVAALR